MKDVNAWHYHQYLAKVGTCPNAEEKENKIKKRDILP